MAAYSDLPNDQSDPYVGALAINYGGGDQVISDLRPRAVFISTGGNLKVDMTNGDTVTFTGLLVGWIYNIAVKKIYQTGSTAAGLVLL
jgi:hypothetical protein